MKRFHIVSLGIITLFLSACSKDKESQCIKGEIIELNPCSRTWGVQIIDGPKIGTTYIQYDNVIELFDVPYDTKTRNAIIYFTYNKKKKQQDHSACIAVLSMPDISAVEKSLSSLSETECE